MSEEDENLQAWIDPELEARVVAAVLGEASAFELAELERIIEEKPELAIFRRRIEAVHGLVALAAKPETEARQLSPERRRKVLEVLGEGSNPGATPVAIPLDEPRQRRRVLMGVAIGIAALLMIVALLASIALPAFTAVQPRSAATKALMEKKQRMLEEQMETAGTAGPESGPVSQAQAPNAMGLSSANPAMAAPAVIMQTRPIMQQALAYNGATRALNGGDLGAKDELAQDKQQVPHELENSVSSEVVEKEQSDLSALTRMPSHKSVAGGGGSGYGSARSPSAQPLGGEERFAVDATTAEPAAADAAGAKIANLNVTAGITTFSGALRTDGGSAASTQNAYPPVGEAVPAAPPAAMAMPAQSAYSYSGKVAALQNTQNTLDGVVNRNGIISGPPSLQTRRADRGVMSGNAASLGSGDDQAQPIISNGTMQGYIQYGAPIGTPAPESAQSIGGLASLAARPSFAKRIIRPEPDQGEVKAADEPFSTFSLHVSDVSFRLAQAALAGGQMPDPDTIRPEEFYNAFDYCDPGPAAGEKISCHIEQCAHPFIQQRNLVRIAMKVAAAGRSQPLRLTVLLDTSGSMEREDRAASVRQAIKVLASLLGSNDEVTLVGFARQPRLLAEAVHGNDAAKLVRIVAHMPSEGGTNLEAALNIAGELAIRHRAEGAQNRIVLLTDGAANLGNAKPARLGAIVARLRQQGIAFDACGVGAEGYNDEILETLTRKGDGRYYFLNRPEDADEGFARQLAGALRPAAQNVKMQVRFNPARVGSYRLIGFEKNRLKTEDFRNDQVAAAELASEEAAVAVYQVEVLPEGEGELGDVFVRFREPADGSMVERSWTMSYDSQAPAFDQASPSVQLAGTAALLAEKLRGGAMGSLVDLDKLAPVVNRLRGHYAPQERVQELVAMFNQVRRMEGKQ